MTSFLALVLAAALLWLVVRRANELCALGFDGGQATLLRGRAPQRFLSDAREIASRAPDVRAVVAVVNEGGAPRVLVQSGNVPDATLQQLRNVAGQHQILHFRSGVRPR